MSLRMEIELTSARPDGTWTWRKAGARQPKGEMTPELLAADAKVGDELSVEYANALDGIEIVQVFAVKAPKATKHQMIELVAQSTPDQLVTTKLAPKGRGDARGDRDRPRRDGGGGRGRGRDANRGRDGDRGREGDRSRDGNRGPDGDRARDGRPDRRPRAPIPERPKAKRLRAGRTHRNAALATLPPEHVPIAEQVLRAGVPGVRQAVEQQNTDNAAKGLPTVKGDELIALAESLVPALRLAEWRDRADAAIANLEELDLRDLRSVVVASEGLKDEAARAQAAELREGLTRRVEAEHNSWLEEMQALLDGGRIVRALRVSSRPPKAGVPLPAPLAAALVAATLENLTVETAQDRWATVIDALSFSPVRTAVTPPAIPAEVSDELLAAVKKSASRLPHIATLFGMEAGPAKRPARSKSPKVPRPPEPVAAAEPTPEPEPVAAAEPTPEPEPLAVAEPTPEPEPVAAAEPTPEPEPEPVATVERPSEVLEQVEGMSEDEPVG